MTTASLPEVTMTPAGKPHLTRANVAVALRAAADTVRNQPMSYAKAANKAALALIVIMLRFAWITRPQVTASVEELFNTATGPDDRDATAKHLERLASAIESSAGGREEDNVVMDMSSATQRLFGSRGGYQVMS